MFNNLKAELTRRDIRVTDLAIKNDLQDIEQQTCR